MPLPLLALAGIAGGAQLLGGITNSISNSSSQRKANQANMKLAEYQYTKDLEMWNKSNDYNLPQNQMSRLKAAGLNPNLVYGSGAVTGNTVAPSMPKYNAPRMEAVTNQNYRIGEAGIDILNQYQSLQANQAQVNNLKAQTDNTVQKTITEGLIQAQTAQNTAKSVFDLGLAKKLEQTSLDAARANLQKVQNENLLNPLVAQNLKSDLATKESTRLSQDQQRQLAKIQSQIYGYHLKNFGIYGKGEAPTIMGVPVEPFRKLGEKVIDWGKTQYSKYFH